MRRIVSSLLLVGCVLVTSCGKKVENGAASGNPETVELTQQLRRYSFEKHKMPENLEELVTAGYLKAVPPAPTGKKYAVDTKRAEVILVNQ